MGLRAIMPRRAASLLHLLALALIGLVLPGAGVDAQERARVEIVPQIGHARDVRSGAFSRDGTHLLTGSEDGTLKLWDLATTRLVRTFSGHKGEVTVVALSPEGGRALSGSKDKTIKLWDVATGRLIRTIYAHLDSSSEVSSVAFSPDGKRLLSSSRGEGAAKLWDADTGRLVHMFRHSTKLAFHSNVSAAVFSPDGTRVATGGVGDHMVSLWDADTGQSLKTFGKLPDKTFGYRVNLAFSPDGTLLLAGDTESLKLWDTATGMPIRTLASHGLGVSGSMSGLGGAYGITFVTFSPDGAFALTSDRENGLEHWRVATGQLVSTLKPKLAETVAISPDATRALSQGPSGQLKLWDAVSGQFLRGFERRSSVVRSVAASPDGTRLLTIDTEIRLWDASSGTLTRSIGESRIGSPVAFSPDGTRLLAGRYNALDLWDLASGRRVHRITTLTPEHVAFSPDGSRLLAFVPDPIMPDTRAKRLGNVVAWDAASGQRLLTFKVQSGLGSAVAFSPAGTAFLAEPQYDQPFSMSDIASGKVIHTFGDRDNTGHVRASAFTMDGARVASGHIGGALRLWDPASGRLVQTLWHAKSVDAVAFSRDGSRLLSGSADSTVKLWDVATGAVIRTFEGHTGEVNSVAFSPDEKRVISGSDDTTARVWDAATGEVLAILLTRPATRTRSGEWLVITPEGFFDASTRGAEMLTVVRGLQVFSIDQFYQGLYRPDLVREKLAGDPDGKVRAAAATLDLDKLIDTGNAPDVRIVSHRANDASRDDRVTLKAQLIDQGGGIGRAEWRINGITVGVVEKAGMVAAGTPVAVQQTVALDPGANTIELVAYNAANLVASAPARTRIVWTGTEPSVPPRLYVLTVGINRYLDSALNLRYAVPDAKTLAAAFTEAGDGYYESVSVTNVLDSDATAAKLDKVFADLAGNVRPRDVFVFFAAGHGKTLDGRYYFIPYDMRYQTVQSLKDDAIDQDKLQAWFARIQARKAVLMFDTCEAGSLTQQRVATRGGLEQKAALGRLIQATGRATLTASTATQEAYEGYGGHGVFTFAILDALARGDVSSNGLIELTELIQHVDGLVPAITEKRWGAKQYPQMDAYGSNFPLVRQVPSLALASDAAIIIPLKPTHVSTESLQVFKEPGSGHADEALAAFKTVTLVKREGAWALIARDGDVLGYVAAAKLHELK
jgi:WD40 repeat protein